MAVTSHMSAPQDERDTDVDSSEFLGIEVLLDKLRCCDLDTHAHCQRVGELCRAIAHSLRIDPETADQIELGGRLHDIGKMEIPTTILNKPGKLSPEERQVIETHPQAGFRMLVELGGGCSAIHPGECRKFF